ncbi:unnamed protein product [Bursaphelenchus xylophilus]|uniref:(pine wood nematode) hypothetical protein n=1 Tax=Bursaphelenchus xylophilus TaxID=6326 RepID=A0A1I7RKE1_BURXY|nr:unnamed protein product [Bursaphelenchus xylophilus]CAG9131366.1 unnamed protein product [Bursaphelenchus xylophilus]
MWSRITDIVCVGGVRPVLNGLKSALIDEEIVEEGRWNEYRSMRSILDIQEVDEMNSEYNFASCADGYPSEFETYQSIIETDEISETESISPINYSEFEKRLNSSPKSDQSFFSTVPLDCNDEKTLESDEGEPAEQMNEAGDGHKHQADEFLKALKQNGPYYLSPDYYYGNYDRQPEKKNEFLMLYP